MYRREHRHQLSLADFFLPFGGRLSGTAISSFSVGPIQAENLIGHGQIALLLPRSLRLSETLNLDHRVLSAQDGNVFI